VGAPADYEVFGLVGGDEAKFFIHHASILRGKLQIKFSDLNAVNFLQLSATAEKVQFVVALFADRVKGEIYFLQRTSVEFLGADIQARDVVEGS
jgi:hypothetical protein